MDQQVLKCAVNFEPSQPTPLKTDWNQQSPDGHFDADVIAGHIFMILQQLQQWSRTAKPCVFHATEVTSDKMKTVNIQWGQDVARNINQKTSRQVTFENG